MAISVNIGLSMSLMNASRTRGSSNGLNWLLKIMPCQVPEVTSSTRATLLFLSWSICSGGML